MSSILLFLIVPAFLVVASKSYSRKSKKQKQYRRSYEAWNRSRGFRYQ
jgi:hypothetical protein